MNTIFVVITDGPNIAISNIIAPFNINTDYIRVGDDIVETEYGLTMTVVANSPCTYAVYEGNKVQSIIPHKINGRPAADVLKERLHEFIHKNFISKVGNKMEERNIKVSLKQAVEWYNSNNSTLRTLALSVYKKEELTPLAYRTIRNMVHLSFPSIAVPSTHNEKIQALCKLLVIASYLNDGWEKSSGNIAYFLSKKVDSASNTIEKYGIEITIFSHGDLEYPGIVYFRREKDIPTALELLGEQDTKILFE